MTLVRTDLLEILKADHRKNSLAVTWVCLDELVVRISGNFSKRLEISLGIYIKCIN